MLGPAAQADGADRSAGAGQGLHACETAPDLTLEGVQDVNPGGLP